MKLVYMTENSMGEISMKKELITELNKTFEGSAFFQDGVEYWMARDLQVLLDYSEWRNFLGVIEKAKEACYNSKQKIADHFVDVNKTIDIPKTTTKEIEDIMLTRYACYLIAQNGDPRKTTVMSDNCLLKAVSNRRNFLWKQIFKNWEGVLNQKLKI